MGDSPILHVNKGLARLVNGDFKVLLDCANDAAFIVPTRKPLAIFRAEDFAEIGVVENNSASWRQARKPSAYLLNGVEIMMAGVDEKKVNTWVNAALRAPRRKFASKRNVIGLNKLPLRIVRNRSAVININANHMSVR